MPDKPFAEPRDLPSVEELLQDKRLSEAMECLPRPIVAGIIREEVDRVRQSIGSERYRISSDDLIGRIRVAARNAARQEISRLINATGIVVHTNLGRAPLSEEIFASIKSSVTGYSNVEFDVATGKRAQRGCAAESYLKVLSESEAGTIVNNCAAALFLILNTLANKKRVVISRGELVQIGGGFRIPDILRSAGARLCEVGTTNITTIDDYESGLEDGGSMILKVHQSNFVQAGFTEGVSLKQLVALGRSREIPVVNDLGSGVFLSTGSLLGYDEPSVQQSVRTGADLTCFSGDKLLGGLQAGLVVGKASLVAKLKRNPIFRTVRVDKIVFSILERLLSAYLSDTHVAQIKLWQLLNVPESVLYARGKSLVANLGSPEGVSVTATKAQVGGGALPEIGVASVGIAFEQSLNANKLARKFRDQTPAVIGRIENNQFVLDLKAVDEADLSYLEHVCRKILSEQ